MKHSTRTITVVLILCGVIWACHNTAPSASTSATASPSVDKVTLPSDALDSCTVTQATFNSWFVSGTASPNGAVNPANSVTFPHVNNCSFYQWSHNMFLWLTSPNNKRYGSGNIVLETPLFYDVLPADSTGKRKLQQHSGTVPLRMASHITKDGPDHLPIIIDAKGKMHEVEQARPSPRLKAMVASGAGNQVEVDHVTADAKRIFTFFDKAGKVIDHPKAVVQHKAAHLDIVQKFTAANGKSVFLNAQGNQVQTEAGQATGDVLMTRNGGLVYYLTMVNDVYAWFFTGVNAGKLNGNQFPTTQGALDSIITYAKANNATLPDSTALAMELKTSWVEASTLPNPDDYITVMAVIPTYNKSDSTKWIPNGEKTVKMAMVGMHIVGSLAGHPEMAWATFEQQSNTPNAEYQYVDNNHKVKTVPRDTGNGWLFNANAADTAVNISHMTNLNPSPLNGTSDTIRAQQGYAISPSNTLAVLPWGSAKDSVTNQEDQSSAASNSEIISINYAIQKMLGNDVRAKYLQVGATWTMGGAAPNGGVYGVDGTAPGVSIGTSVLANTTMETYFQQPIYSCFTCHHSRTTPSLNPSDLSHIYGELEPLTAMHEELKKKKK
ncbi:MAG: hypothetical protein ACTHMI_21750 [Mucilaginibacter sp.]